jgi:hypothetical protein
MEPAGVAVNFFRLATTFARGSGSAAGGCGTSLFDFEEGIAEADKRKAIQIELNMRNPASVKL